MLGISCYQPLKEKANDSKESDSTTAVEDKSKELPEKDVAAKDGSDENVDVGQEEETSKTGTGSPTEGKVLWMSSIVYTYCCHGNFEFMCIVAMVTFTSAAGRKQWGHSESNEHGRT